MNPKNVLSIPPPLPAHAIRHDRSLFTADDLFLFNEGNNYRAHQKLGCHALTVDAQPGCNFAVWAPNAEFVSVMGDFNGWNTESHPLHSREQSGIWEGFIPGVPRGSLYKYHIVSRFHGYRVDKTDPFAFFSQVSPNTASVVWDFHYEWGDREWMESRRSRNPLHAPMAIYEVHLGSWRRRFQEGNRSLTYRELAHELPQYVREMGFTHVEFLPVTEHPFYGSWGYQTTGYFAPTSRFGTPQDLMYLIDMLHREGIGVILDWVPSHFPKDAHGLAYFDGTSLFEHSDWRLGWHPDWDSYIFNYGRNEVRSFLLSSGIFWLEQYHADGLRVDAVASMLYLDYSRKDGEWIPNQYGGRENLEALAFLRRFNEVTHHELPDTITIAEESTSWGMVSRPTYVGGLGFDMKWDMGWMHDTLQYMAVDSLFRMYHHNELTFRSLYAFSENFVLALSHDEVVHGKGSLLNKMSGQGLERFANLRLLFGYMYTQPGKKLLFMGAELAQWSEWSHERAIDWDLLQHEPHAGVQRWLRDLNAFYKAEPALHDLDFDPAGYEWISGADFENSVICYLRKGRFTREYLLVACNFTPVPRIGYRVGVPVGGYWREILNSDAQAYGGSGYGNLGGVEASGEPHHGRPHSLVLTLPSLSITVFKLTV